MTDECISPLRRRMIEDMTVRNFVPKTQSDYIRRVKNFAVFLGRTPDRASREDVRGYLLHLASSGVGAKGNVEGIGLAMPHGDGGDTVFGLHIDHRRCLAGVRNERGFEGDR